MSNLTAEQRQRDLTLVDTSNINTWKSIITLIVFVITNVVVLFPFQVPIYVPRSLWEAFLNTLSSWRIRDRSDDNPEDDQSIRTGRLTVGWKGVLFVKDLEGHLVRFQFLLNFITAPLIADLFLLAITAIGRKEVNDGTIGIAGISPLDIMGFFFSLAYIAISIDASGLVRFLVCRVLELGGNHGRLLFFYLYVFFFVLTGFIGNDPVILSGTAFLAYMTRVSGNIEHPRAWIHSQFAVANIGSAILVSSNPTNLVLASAFSIKFIHYTYNMFVPVIITAIALFPLLLFVLWTDHALIPPKITKITLQELPPEENAKEPVNPNVYHAKVKVEETDSQEAKDMQLKDILRPFIDWKGAGVGAAVMAGVLVALLIINAKAKNNHYPVFYVTLPGAFVLFCWDFFYGWHKRHDTRQSALKLREEDEARIAKQAALKEIRRSNLPAFRSTPVENDCDVRSKGITEARDVSPAGIDGTGEKSHITETYNEATNTQKQNYEPEAQKRTQENPKMIVSRLKEAHFWMQMTFPTVTEVVSILPYPLLPFALSMFVLVQGLASKGWIPVFAYGWDHWVNKTGTMGAIGGMGFLSVVLCNFAGTNIGTTILLCRVIQAWQAIHRLNGLPISNRTFWGTIYSMALGVNYGAFSAAFSASLAGLLWREILARQHIHVKPSEFTRVNLPIIAVAMTIGCITLVGQIYIFRGNTPYDMPS